MRISPVGVELIHAFEQFRAKSYKDSVGIWTIGWGSTRIFGRAVRWNDKITKGQGDHQFEKDIREFEKQVKKYVKVSVNQNMFDALVSITYNMGPENLRTSSLLRHLNNNDIQRAGESFMLYVKARNRKTGKVKTLRGLVRRREAEKQLFLTPESGHHLFELVENLSPRGLDKLFIHWNKRRYEI